jgi:chorismate-pyruvate lyase
MHRSRKPWVICRGSWLPGDDALVARALREAELKPAGLWARRLRIALRGAPLLIQEVFLPATGRL